MRCPPSGPQRARARSGDVIAAAATVARIVPRSRHPKRLFSSSRSTHSSRRHSWADWNRPSSFDPGVGTARPCPTRPSQPVARGKQLCRRVTNLESRSRARSRRPPAHRLLDEAGKNPSTGLLASAEMASAKSSNSYSPCVAIEVGVDPFPNASHRRRTRSWRGPLQSLRMRWCRRARRSARGHAAVESFEWPKRIVVMGYACRHVAERVFHSGFHASTAFSPSPSEPFVEPVSSPIPWSPDRRPHVAISWTGLKAIPF